MTKIMLDINHRLVYTNISVEVGYVHAKQNEREDYIE